MVRGKAFAGFLSTMVRPDYLLSGEDQLGSLLFVMESDVNSSFKIDKASRKKNVCLMSLMELLLASISNWNVGTSSSSRQLKEKYFIRLRDCNFE